MNPPTPTVLTETDLGTLLHGLAWRLRTAGLALEGLAGREGGRGDPAYEALQALADSLEREALVTEAVAKGLCRSCRLAEVSEQLRLGSPYRIVVRPTRAAEPPAAPWRSLDWGPAAAGIFRGHVIRAQAFTCDD